jgi:hypothetical protein
MPDHHEPTDAELHRIARALIDAVHTERLPPNPHGAPLPVGWMRVAARAAWSLGARHDGEGVLCGPVRRLGG